MNPQETLNHLIKQREMYKKFIKSINKQIADLIEKEKLIVDPPEEPKDSIGE